MEPVVLPPELFPPTVIIIEGKMWQLTCVLEDTGYRAIAINLENKEEILQGDIPHYRIGDAWTSLIHKIAHHHGIRKNAGDEVRESRAFAAKHGRDATRW